MTKVLFINEIVYGHPALFDSPVGEPDAPEGGKIIGLTTSRYSGTLSTMEECGARIGALLDMGAGCVSGNHPLSLGNQWGALC